MHRLLNVNQLGRSRGLAIGQSLADARAICPELLTEPENAARDALLLSALRRWADRFSPKVELAPPDGLVLDVSGIAHLHGDEASYLSEVEAGFQDLRMTLRTAMANTPAAARAWARYRPRSHSHDPIIAQGDLLSACDGLPVEALETKATEALRLLGLNTVEDLRARPSAQLARRFGLEVTDALDRLMGKRPEPMKAEAPARPFATRITLPEPVSQSDAVLAITERIAAPLMKRLEQDGLGALVFELTIVCPDSETHTEQVGFSRPSRETRALIRQLRTKIETVSLPFGAERFRLEAKSVQPIQTRQVHLSNDAAVEDSMERLVTLLGNRIGFDRIRRPVPSQSHRPERECASEQVADGDGAQEWPQARLHRPLQMFEPEHLHILEAGRPPRRFQWRRTAYTTVEVEGPERVAPQWWADEPGMLSDYFKVSTQEGPRLWLRRLPRHPDFEWSVAGVFA